MTIALWCVLIAGMMSPLTGLLAKSGKVDGKRYDNNHPRQWLAKLEGRPARAVAAMNNSFESFPLFAAAVIIAHIGGAAQETVNMLAMGYIAVRVLYTAFYLMNLGVLRSATWGAGVAIVVALFCIVP
ncbi:MULTISPECIES: MAPEG family protein [Spongiibacter]|uniref:MAPEG family protein n=1 Tax=Spongiibacter TaxID=630749 RepID=UPI000C5F4847|nr:MULTISPECIES: MAPEG family protein [Spongiibacter]MAY39424.1 hypothetical protein [Spongiibacter sp.]MBI57294.1 hypothetical protein [Spongiibacter sp.]MBO6753013.1 MAPEG family protein [Spongiibacter sp.]|tara:strand:- start:32822 stop:33205 length:384 start_codon:yes stop_codon:yes gene_type:complete